MAIANQEDVSKPINNVIVIDINKIYIPNDKGDETIGKVKAMLVINNGRIFIIMWW